MSFTNPWSPLTAIVIVHIVYINESNPYTPLSSLSPTLTLKSILDFFYFEL